jgi:hypothetical protein
MSKYWACDGETGNKCSNSWIEGLTFVCIYLEHMVFTFVGYKCFYRQFRLLLVYWCCNWWNGKVSVNYYNFAALNPNMKKKIRYQLTFFWNFISCFFTFSTILLYFTRICKCVTGSDGLKSRFHVELNIRNSKITTRMLYENNFLQLHNKNVKRNVWF